MAAPAAFAAGGLPLAVVIAVAVTAVVAVGMAFSMLRRTMRLTGFIAGVGATTVLVILVGSLFVGGSLTRPPATAVADEGRGSASLTQVTGTPARALAKLLGHPPVEAKLSGLQLPTLGLDG